MMETVLATPKEQLLARLDDPDVVDSLNRFLDQLPLLAFGAEALHGFIKRGDTIAGNISDVFLRRSDTIIENIRDSVKDATSLLPDQEMLSHLQDLAASAPHLIEAVSNLVDGGMVEKLRWRAILRAMGRSG